MTPEAKAKELIDNMSKQTYSFQEYAGARSSVEEIGYEAGKKCAIVAVDEILNILSPPDGGEYQIEFWEDVKAAIDKL